MTRRAYGRRFALDARDRDYAVRLPGSDRARRYWNEGAIWLDQEEFPRCVGYAWAHWLLAEPLRQYLPPAGIYDVAQLLDEWEGEGYEGTSVRAGAKALQALGFVERYEWAFDVETVAAAVLEVGPVVMGTNWYGGMNRTTRGLRWKAQGRELGGHAWLITGVDLATELFRCRNSHLGNARGFISFDDVARLLDEEGEACLAIEASGAKP